MAQRVRMLLLRGIMKTANELTGEAGVEELAWLNLSESFRRACALYHEGREGEAMRIARDELPGLIEHWGGASGLGGHARRLRLMSMFIEEGRRVGEGALAQKMFSAYLSAQAVRNRKTREILRGGSRLVGTIRLMGETAPSSEVETAVPLDFEGDPLALQMIR